MASPFVYFKEPQVDSEQQADITSMLLASETVTAIVASAVTPGSDTPLTVTINSSVNPIVDMLLSGGDNGTSYGFKLTVTTNARVFLVSVAVSVYDQPFVPYVTSNPSAFTDLVDQVEAGNAAIGTAVFSFPAQIPATGGFVTWELLSSDGTVYSAGNAYDYIVQSSGFSNNVLAKCVISVPSNVPPSLDGQRYQLRYTLELPLAQGTQPDPQAGVLGQNTFFQYENVRVVGLNTVPLGTQPSVELQGVPATVSIVVDKLYDNVTVELWASGVKVAQPSAITDYERTTDGFYFAGVIDTSQLMVSLVPYTLIWKYWMTNSSAIIYQESADFFVVNPSIMTAITDVKSKINKAVTTLYGTPDLLYPAPVVLTWLRRGMDSFNGAYGVFTSFTMTNAQGPVREFWLLCAEVAALESQYLAEGEKAFNFQGAAISLDVDRTQYLDAAASKIQSKLDQELKPVKQNLVIKGATGGDGSVDPSKLQQGAIGAVGITITAASMWGRLAPLYTRGIR